MTDMIPPSADEHFMIERLKPLGTFVLIMQGIPGSGKSTVAQRIASTLRAHWGEPEDPQQSSVLVLSADDYWIEDGKYRYDASRAGEAHEWNQTRTREALRDGFSVIIDNTNIEAWQARPYAEMGVERNATVEFLRCDGEWESIHGVPENVMISMRARIEDLDLATVLNSLSPYEKIEALAKSGITCPQRLPALFEELRHILIDRPVETTNPDDARRLREAAKALRLVLGG